MTSNEDRIKMHNIPSHIWSIREQLYLTLSVLKFGEQNWISVSHLLKPISDKHYDRPSDWFSPKSCADQYAYLVEYAEATKRKKKESGETTSESIIRRLTQEWLTELSKLLALQREEYFQIRDEINLLKNGTVSDEKLQKMWFAIEEEKDKNQDKKSKSQTFVINKRQQFKEIQSSQIFNVQAVKKQLNESLTENKEIADVDYKDNEKTIKIGEKPSLLTCLLKSPSTTIQNQTPTSASSTIANLLSSSSKFSKQVNIQNLTQTQQLSNIRSNTLPEKPSISAPTLSMLLEHSCTGSDKVLKQQLHIATESIELKNIQNSDKMNVVQTKVSQLTVPESVTLISQKQPNISNSELKNIELPQIIASPIDVVIPKVLPLDKDEINEIIGDIEELIKEDIKDSPNKSLPFSEITKNVDKYNDKTSNDDRTSIITESSKSRNIDESVSLSNSPTSEISIGEIDSSTSNIAEIIGMTINTSESKETLIHVTNSSNKIKLFRCKETTNKDTETVKFNQETKIHTTIDSDNNTANNKEVIKLLWQKKLNINEEDIKFDAKIAENAPKIQNILDKEKTNTKHCIANKLKQDTLLRVSKTSNSSKQGSEQEKINDVIKKEQSLLKDGLSNLQTEEIQKIGKNEEDIASSNDSSNIETKSLNNEFLNSIVIKTEIEQDKYDSKNVSNDSFTENSLNSKDLIDNSDLKSIAENKNSVEIINYEIDLDSSDNKIKLKNITALHNNVAKPHINKEAVPSTDTNNICFDNNEKISEVKITIKSEIVEDNNEICYEQNKEKIKKEIASIAIKKEEESPERNTQFDEEEPSTLSKLSSGRVMKTYSKKQNSIVDNEVESDICGETADYKTWKKHIMTVYNTLATHKYASKFLRPITEDQAPGYHSIIFRPMDLWTIKKNIDNGTIRSTAHFQRDVMLMFQNAIMFNKHNTFVHKMTLEMQEECLQHIQDLMQAVGEASFSRKTRTAANISNDATDNSLKRKWNHLISNSYENDSPRTKKRGKSENE